MSDKRPWKHRVLLCVGSIGPLGHLPASGSVTVAVVGVPLFWVLADCPPYMYIVLVVVLTLASITVHELGDRILGENDSRQLVWDELVGYFIAVALVPFTWRTALLAYVVERVIDIVKVPPARWLDRHVHNGVGVVRDDVVAGLYTCGLLHTLLYLCPEWLGVQ